MGIRKIKELGIYDIIIKKMFNLQKNFVENNIKKNMVMAFSQFVNLVVSVIVFSGFTT